MRILSNVFINWKKDFETYSITWRQHTRNTGIDVITPTERYKQLWPCHLTVCLVIYIHCFKLYMECNMKDSQKETVPQNTVATWVSIKENDLTSCNSVMWLLLGKLSLISVIVFQITVTLFPYQFWVKRMWLCAGTALMVDYILLKTLNTTINLLSMCTVICFTSNFPKYSQTNRKEIAKFVLNISKR